MNKKVILNSIITPDGTELNSYDVHDYKLHKDENGEVYINDGGNEYLRRSVNKEPYLENSVFDTDPIEVKRERIEWGTFREGKRVFLKIKDLSDAHIKAIIRDGYKGSRIEVMKEELGYRAENNIIIEDTYQKGVKCLNYY
jgi:predicted DNA-binding antitoxin AbrB/MazE fold protein